MSNKLPSNQTKTVSVKMDKDTVEKADEYIEQSAYSSRSEFIREKLRTIATENQDTDSWQPPEDEKLAESYQQLCSIRNDSGIVRGPFAERKIASALSIAKSDVRPEVLIPLEKRGYLKLLHGEPATPQDYAVEVRPYANE